MVSSQQQNTWKNTRSSSEHSDTSDGNIFPDVGMSTATMLYDDSLDEETERESGSNEAGSSNVEAKTASVERTAKRTVVIACLVLIFGAVASTLFLYSGISNALDEQDENFERLAHDLVKEIDASWQDYENAALWIYESCRKRDYSHQDFEDLHQYLVASGIEFYAVSMVLNITHDQRAQYEADSKLFYATNYPDFNYQGFVGQEPSPQDPAEFTRQPRSPQPFYFTVQYTAPVYGNEASIGLDLKSLEYEYSTILTALETFSPVLTGRIDLMQDTAEDSYSVILRHPGVPLQSDPDLKPGDTSEVIIRMRDLLTRASSLQSNNLGAYIYDFTNTDPEFLGAIEISNQDETKELYFPPETSFASIPSSDKYYERNLFIASRQWKVVVLSIDDSFEPTLAPIVVGGVLVFVGSLVLALWMLTNMRKSLKMHRLMRQAAAEASIVANLFPPTVRERMISDAKHRNKQRALQSKRSRAGRPLTSEGIFGSRPIAELFPYTTVMHADLSGFTSWSSTREPSQVFTLLEVLYHAFDSIGKKRKVFKIETVGDCYVAACGLPKACDNHAIVMARFAADCVQVANKLFKALEVTLGPDTGDLGLRVGLHSGQVIAGVLRGDKGRFQLLGNTINMSATMEATGERNLIQVSQETADLLEKSGGASWLIPRADKVKCKGHGELQTYWCKISSASQGSAKQMITESDYALTQGKMERLVGWNVQSLCVLLQQIIARRKAAMKKTTPISAKISEKKGTMALDEVKEVITLPSLDEAAVGTQVDPESIDLDREVVSQLRDLIRRIAEGYRDNPFHNFEHASHVAISVLKMLSRIVDPKELRAKRKRGKFQEDYSAHEKALHDHTFGITSDPLTQFACAFSALIHDLDHQGVTNATLIKEDCPLAHLYKNKSIAEQNSIDLSWSMFLEPKYEKLRNTICCNQTEFERFRQLCVNSVCATDIMDKELGAARKNRWNKAFEDAPEEEPASVSTNRKATIVIEHLIQASDISHTMQHWHVYAKWNEALFHETYKAYKQKRIETDPTDGWYEGEKGFFDFYIIPLAKKLSKCGVFGVSSDEFLNYATANRKEWEAKGAGMIKQYLINFEEKYGKDGSKGVGTTSSVDVAVESALEDVRGRLQDRVKATGV